MSTPFEPNPYDTENIFSEEDLAHFELTTSQEYAEHALGIAMDRARVALLDASDIEAINEKNRSIHGMTITYFGFREVPFNPASYQLSPLAGQDDLGLRKVWVHVLPKYIIDREEDRVPVVAATMFTTDGRVVRAYICSEGIFSYERAKDMPYADIVLKNEGAAMPILHVGGRLSGIDLGNVLRALREFGLKPWSEEEKEAAA